MKSAVMQSDVKSKSSNLRGGEFTNTTMHLLLEGARRFEDATLMESASTFRTKLELAS